MKKSYLLFFAVLLSLCSCDCFEPEDMSCVKIEGAEAVGIQKYCFSPYSDSLVYEPVPIKQILDYFRTQPVLLKLTGPERLMDYGSYHDRGSDYYPNSFLFWFDGKDSIVCVWDLRKDSPDSNDRWRDPLQWKVDSTLTRVCPYHGNYLQTFYTNTFVFDSSDITNNAVSE